MKNFSKTQINHPVTIDTGLLVIRAMLAVVFLFHGGQKLFGLFGGHGIAGMAGYLEGLGVPFPMASALLAGSAEFFGGAALLTGVGLRIAAIPMVITMLVASFTANGGAFSAQAGGMEYPLTLAAMLTGLGLTGPGRFTLVRAMRAIVAPRTPIAATDTTG